MATTSDLIEALNKLEMWEAIQRAETRLFISTYVLESSCARHSSNAESLQVCWIVN